MRYNPIGKPIDSIAIDADAVELSDSVAELFDLHLKDDCWHLVPKCHDRTAIYTMHDAYPDDAEYLIVVRDYEQMTLYLLDYSIRPEVRVPYVDMDCVLNLRRPPRADLMPEHERVKHAPAPIAVESDSCGICDEWDLYLKLKQFVPDL